MYNFSHGIFWATFGLILLIVGSISFIIGIAINVNYIPYVVGGFMGLSLFFILSVLLIPFFLTFEARAIALLIT